MPIGLASEVYPYDGFPSGAIYDRQRQAVAWVAYTGAEDHWARELNNKNKGGWALSWHDAKPIAFRMEIHITQQIAKEAT
jgi:hypothetical protein